MRFQARYTCPLTVARRQAQVRGIPTRHELLLYAIHGMLHLSDYDDLTPRKYQAMHKEEDRILQQLGFGPVFGRADAAASRKPRLNLSEKRLNHHHVSRTVDCRHHRCRPRGDVLLDVERMPCAIFPVRGCRPG